MTIQEIKSDYRNGKLTKPEFADKMHEYHSVLFAFAENLAGTEIERIEIEDGKVIFVTRHTHFHPGGVKFYLDIADKRITPLEAFNFDQYEREDSEMLYSLVSDGDTIFDIGANIGWYSNHLSKKLPHAKIYCFEPIPETYRQLEANVALNKANNIVLNNFAFSDAVRTLSFYYSPALTGASSSVNITENETMTLLECPATTLDTFVQENHIEKLDFIKCDVEGAELMVYKGGHATIAQHKPVVFSEMLRKWAAKFGYHPNDIIDFYGQFGYHCFTAHQGKLVPFGRVDDTTLETNYFFLDPEKHAGRISSLS